MPLPIVLRVRATASGSWRVAVDDRRTRPVEGELPSEAVRDLLARCSQLDRQRFASVAVPGPRGEARCAAAEEALGSTLGSLVRELPDLRARLSAHLGRAAGSGELAAIAVDADPEHPEMRALPWELLAGPLGEGPVEASGQAVVVRVVAGPALARPPVAARPRILTWNPTADDPACRAVSAELVRALDAAGLGSPIEVDPTRGTWPAPGGGHSDVLHVVCHGVRDLDQVGLLLPGDDGRPPGAVAHMLAGALPGLLLVVLDVCGGGEPLDSELASLVGRLGAAGAPLVAAARRRVSVEAACAFGRGLYAGLGAGQPVAAAVAEGRRQVRALGRPYPDARWCHHALHVSDLEALAATATKAAWRPEGCPAPSPAAAKWLERAEAASRERSDGYVGLEHLLLARADLGGLHVPGAAGDWIRDVEEAFRTRPRGLVAASGDAASPRATPRLAAAAARLRPGFGPAHLWAVLVESLGLGTGPDPAPGGAETVDVGDTSLPRVSGSALNAAAPPASGNAGAPLVLQVVGGPEDGRVLEPRPGDTLGRWDAQNPVTHAFYRGTPLVDSACHRRQADWLGAGRLRLLYPVRLIRRGERLKVHPDDLQAGALTLDVGDLLVLTPGTRLGVPEQGGFTGSPANRG